MRIRTSLIILFTLPAAAALADCKPNLEARATSKITIGNITPDCNFGEPQRGDAVSIKASDATVAATVVTASSEPESFVARLLDAISRPRRAGRGVAAVAA